MREKKFLHGIVIINALTGNHTRQQTTTTTTTTTEAETTETTSEDPHKDFFETQTVVYDFNWTPIPKRPTFGPSPAPPNYKDLSSSIEELSGLAQVTLTDNKSELANFIKARNDTRNPIVNVQLLPPRLSAVLFHVQEKHRALLATGPTARYPAGIFRQNKIAPVFKLDPTGLDKKRAKSLRGEQVETFR
jgi:hypothetical protein